MILPYDSDDMCRSESELLTAFACGDAEAARILTHELTPKAYRQALGMLGDAQEAEDVTWEVMGKLWRMAPSWQSGQAKVSTWLYRVVANACLDRLRASARKNSRLDDVAEPVDMTPQAGELLMQHVREDALNAALLALPERQRLAIVLRHIEELPNPEIARIMEINVAAVESLIARGKRALKAILTPQRSALGYEGDER